MMKNLKALLLAVSITGASSLAYAATDTVEPQSTAPDSTQTGDYLKTQPDENGAAATDAKTSVSKHKISKHKKTSTSKPTNLEKGKTHTESPESGGVDVQPK